MTLELSITQRRLVLQGLWKEQDMYNNMLNNTTDTLVTKHAIDNINAIMDLENKLLGIEKQ
jgi:sRNA-binding regulator protein Hfq